MVLISENKLVEKKSKFYTELHSISSEEELKKTINEFSKKHSKATHICQAFIIRGEKGFKNDGEVGSPGRVLLSILENNNLENNLLITARYFGGIKLGPSGVARAFRKSGKECINKL